MNYQQRNQAYAKLRAAGWTKLFAVTHDGNKDNLKYGTFWVKEGHIYYFNDQTIHNLPA